MPAHRATFRLLCPPFVGTENRQSFQRPEPMSQPASTKRVITALSAANFVIGMGALMVVGLLSPVASDFRIPPAEAGLMMTYYAVGYAILSPLLISLTGQIGRRRILTAALFIFALSNLCALLAPTPTLLFLSRILTATGAGLFTPVAAAVAAGLSPPDRQARALAAVFFGLTLSQVMGVPAGGFIAYTFGWRAAFAMILVLTLPFIVILWRTVPAGLRFQPVSLSDLGRSITNPRDVLALLFTVFFVGSTFVVYTYIAPLLTETMGFGRNGITLILLLFGGGAVVGNLASGIVTDRIGAFRMLIILCVAQICLLPFYSLMPLSLWVLIPVCFGWSTFGWSFNAAQQLRLISMDRDNAGVLLALNAAAIYVGTALGAYVGGRVLNTAGLLSLGAAAALCAAGALVLLLVSEALIRRRRAAL